MAKNSSYCGIPPLNVDSGGPICHPSKSAMLSRHRLVFFSVSFTPAGQTSFDLVEQRLDSRLLSDKIVGLWLGLGPLFCSALLMLTFLLFRISVLFLLGVTISSSFSECEGFLGDDWGSHFTWSILLENGGVLEFKPGLIKVLTVPGVLIFGRGNSYKRLGSIRACKGPAGGL